MEQRRRARAAVVAAAVAVASVAATLAVLAAARGGARPAALAPQPFLAPYTEFNADEGSAGPAHNRAALDFQAGKAGASQEWLQYSLHHDGTLQQARARRGVRAVRGAAARTERARADTGSQPRGAVESSGNFQDDDGSLFGDDTFDAAEASKGEPMPYQEDGAPQDGSDDEDYYCVDEHGNEVDCGDDYYCVDEQGNEVDCDEEEEEPEEEEPGPSDFLKSMVKAVASGAQRCGRARRARLTPHAHPRLRLARASGSSAHSLPAHPAASSKKCAVRGNSICLKETGMETRPCRLGRVDSAVSAAGQCAELML